MLITAPFSSFPGLPGFLSFVNMVTIKLSPSSSSGIKDVDVTCLEKLTPASLFVVL